MSSHHITRAALVAAPPVFTTTLAVTAGITPTPADLVYCTVIAMLPAAGLWHFSRHLPTGRPAETLRNPGVWAAVTTALLACLTIAAFCYGYFFAFLLAPLLGIFTAFSAVGCVALHRRRRSGVALSIVPPTTLAMIALLTTAASTLTSTVLAADIVLLIPAGLTWITSRQRDPFEKP
ncbi:hypothetical protein CFP65_3816 [Kitasatospora sp. MMS16-BH015]|uniref:hypothetical protein n=1 Tax=Kitasatospora sp. MMS16-BH015 TaxID=2018025 RepID=UPI000CA38B5F|nr:hypothetical protein [Kitasatospora sp. MMS16-BH015]AUG78596.1 hypothetical protein CFP65_3816 [Kitasatospora sp. MMS16-BH015]